MTDLKILVDGPGASSLPYVDPAFPDRSAGRCTPPGPVNTMREHRFCLCTTASVAMAKITGIIGSTWLTKPASWQSRSSFPRRRSPSIFGTILAICTTKTARQTRAKHGPLASMNGYSSSCARKELPPGNAMDCSVTPPAANSSTGWSPLVFAIMSPLPSAPMPAPMRCRICRYHGPLAWERRMSITMHCTPCWPFRLR